MIFRGITMQDGCQPSYFCRGLMHRPTLREILTRGIGEFMSKKKVKKDNTIRNVRFSPLMKTSIKRQLLAWAKSKDLEKVVMDK